MLFLLGRFVLGRHRKDPVGVHFKRHLNLWRTAGSRRDACEVKLAKEEVVLSSRPLALEDADRDRLLVVRMRREHLRLLRRYRGILVNDGRHHTSDRLDSQRQRRDVEDEHLPVTLSTELSSQDCSPMCDSLVGIHATVDLFPIKEFLQETLDLRNARGAPDHDDLINLGLSKP
mmetsp:Transcript_15270/g.29936  ORF Transcript_15270/g.29936 Transcript_15270/m.29936 type:complete len:174 (-) Transcript_15270:1135-1656(-)